MKSEIGESRPRPRWKQWLVEKLDLNSQSHADIRQALQKINEKHILPDQTIGMLQGVLEYGNLVAQDIMIPRSQVDFIQTQTQRVHAIVGGDNDSPELLAQACQDAQLLIHESTYTRAILDKVGSGPMHSSAKMVACSEPSGSIFNYGY